MFIIKKIKKLKTLKVPQPKPKMLVTIEDDDFSPSNKHDKGDKSGMQGLR